MSDILKKKLKTLFVYFIILFFFVILWNALQKALDAHFSTIDFEVYILRQSENTFKKNLLEVFLSLVIVFPILEECTFRTLIKPSKKDIHLFLIGLASLLMIFALKPYMEWYLVYGTVLIFFITAFFLTKRIRLTLKFVSATEKLLNKNRNIYLILIISSLVFGLAHVFNYGKLAEINISILLLIVPRIVSGFIYGIFKKNNGIKWSIALHAFRNLILFLITLI